MKLTSNYTKGWSTKDFLSDQMWVLRDKRFKDALNIFDLGHWKDDVAINWDGGRGVHCEAGLWEMIRGQSYALSRHLGQLSEPNKQRFQLLPLHSRVVGGTGNAIHKKIIWMIEGMRARRKAQSRMWGSGMLGLCWGISRKKSVSSRRNCSKS